MKYVTGQKKLKKAVKTAIIGKKPSRTLARSAATALLCFIIFGYVLIPARINGISMEPAYRDGSINFINTLAYARRDPRRHDVVGIRLAGLRVMLLKRIIGLPGESLSFREGKLYINGEPYDEPWIERRSNWTMPEVKIEQDEYFVAGDNRRMPIESHKMGRVRRERIVGRAIF